MEDNGVDKVWFVCTICYRAFHEGVDADQHSKNRHVRSRPSRNSDILFLAEEDLLPIVNLLGNSRVVAVASSRSSKGRTCSNSNDTHLSNPSIKIEGYTVPQSTFLSMTTNTEENNDSQENFMPVEGHQTASNFTTNKREADAKRYSCIHCTRKFKEKKRLELHLNFHFVGGKAAPKNKSEYPRCPVCRKRVYSLEQHLRTHTGEKPFKCKYCQLTFSLRGNRNRHQLTHSDPYDKPTCQVCGQQFKHMRYLKQHQARFKHSNKDNKEKQHDTKIHCYKGGTIHGLKKEFQNDQPKIVKARSNVKNGFANAFKQDHSGQDERSSPTDAVKDRKKFKHRKSRLNRESGMSKTQARRNGTIGRKFSSENYDDFEVPISDDYHSEVEFDPSNLTKEIKENVESSFEDHHENGVRTKKVEIYEAEEHAIKNETHIPQAPVRRSSRSRLSNKVIVYSDCDETDDNRCCGDDTEMTQVSIGNNPLSEEESSVKRLSESKSKHTAKSNLQKDAKMVRMSNLKQKHAVRKSATTRKRKINLLATRCKICKDRIVDMTRHLEIFHSPSKGDKPYKCNLCEETFKTRDAKNKHRRKKHPDFLENKFTTVYECKHCPSTYVKLYALRNHLELVHKITNDIVENVIKVDSKLDATDSEKIQVSNINYASNSSLITNGVDSTLSSLTIESNETPGFDEVLDHIQTKQNKIPSSSSGFLCHLCNKHYKDRKLLNHHIRRLHFHISGGGTKNGSVRNVRNTALHPCKLCPDQTLTLQNLTIHIRLFHKNQYPKDFMCSLCGATFIFSNNLKVHTTLVHTQKAEPKIVSSCDTCGRKFNSLTNLKKHVLKTHSAINDEEHLEHLCSICGKSFRWKENLNKHSFLHKSERPFKCSLCNATFKIKNDLTRHHVVHSKIRPFKCFKCNASYKTIRSLRMHFKAKQHENEADYIPLTSDSLEVSVDIPRSFDCSHCDATFKDRSGLKKHQYVHTNQRPFNCWNCDVNYKRRVELMRHLKRKHPAELPMLKTRYPVSNAFNFSAVSGDGTVRPFKCTTCSATFRKKIGLKKHQIVHTEDRPFQCPKCDHAPYKTKEMLMRHVKDKHPDEDKQSIQSFPQHLSTSFSSQLIVDTDS